MILRRLETGMLWILTAGLTALEGLLAWTWLRHFGL